MKIINLKNICPEPTTHLVGQKFVFMRETENLSNLTQAALGILTKEDKVLPHSHETMDECYFFLEGNAIFFLGKEKIFIEPNTFVYVPSGIKHFLTTESITKFFYFGISVKHEKIL
jgi:mannose-6-phosphate isomerase-like protein (cupin superfamily)